MKHGYGCSKENCYREFLVAAQDQALRINWIIVKKEKEKQLDFQCKIVTHIVNECNMLAQREDKKRHDKLG